MSDRRPFSRRDFVNMAVHALLSLGGVIGLGGLVRFFSYEPDPGPPDEYNLGAAVDYPPGSRTVRLDIPAVIYNRDGKLVAYSLTCTHLGCTVEEDKQGGFVCPCHQSRFDADGSVLAGPAQKSLPELRLEVQEDGALHLYAPGGGHR
ncbi:MAG: Rieske (2Fe-2S) protein [Anaerolineales bacterium]|nr:Rieske (2Fe-2S) protein [Anaerolineales bacterium]